MAFATAAFDENVRKIIDEWKVPGLGIAVVQGDQIQSKVPLIFVIALKTCSQRSRVTALLT